MTDHKTKKKPHKKAEDVPLIVKIYKILVYYIKKSTFWKVSVITVKTLIVLALLGVILASYFLSRNYYDNDLAVKMLNDNARVYSKGLCAMYVRSAIEHGGVPTYGFPGNAFEYVDFLPRLDFKKIADEDTRDYHPQKGDIMVFGSQKHHYSGHIAMYNGRMWVSDFKQPRGMWVAPVYKANPDFKVYRRKDGWCYRSISLREYAILLRDLPSTWRSTVTRWKTTQARLEKKEA